MFENWQLIFLSFSYITLLFFIAYMGDRYRRNLYKSYHPFIYALSLGVYCTSWSFLGTTAQASTNVLSHIPIYLGPILLFIFAWPFIQRIIRVSLKLNLTSIADLLASRFGKSRPLARLVTLVAVIGALPYLALQLKAIIYSFQILQIEQEYDLWQVGLAVSIILAWFTVVFGIRSIDVTERHPGVMLAIAFESLVKLLAFIAVGVFVSFFLFDSPIDIWQQAETQMSLDEQFTGLNLAAMVGSLVVVMAAFIALPRQFQVMVVELKVQKDTWLSRKIFPIYLLIFALLAIPLGLAGHMLLYGQVPADAYVLYLPQVTGQNWLSLFAFLGAISAASSMVIITSIALSTMLSNEVFFPLLFKTVKQKQADYEKFRFRLLNIRKALVFLVIMLGYGAFYFASPDTLATMGEMAFGAIAQLTPALVAAFYWRSATLKGVFVGISVGFISWCFLNFFPQLGMYPHPFQDSMMPPVTVATLISLTSNLFMMWFISQFTRQSVQERVQAALFTGAGGSKIVNSPKIKQLDENELKLLVSRFVGDEITVNKFALFHQLHDNADLNKQEYNQQLLEMTEQTLASVMGASSARLVLNSALEGRDIALEELAVMMEDASHQRFEFIKSAIENASEGISIIDGELNLVAWNRRYVELFQYPPELLEVGMPIEKLIRYNVEQGLTGPGDPEQQVRKRLEYLKQGSPHNSERERSNGQVIGIQGNPLPGGGFVMMFTDITAYRKAELVLKEANLDLESRVQERTVKLEEANRQLLEEQGKAHLANLKKSQYLKAISHDLMQPLEAARLFTSALANQNELNDVQKRQVTNINDSLKVANDLLTSLGEIARIEGGNIRPHIEPFSLQALFEELAQDFSVLTESKQVEFRYVKTQVWVKSDRHLLRRILQNLLGNAFRYASPGKVLLGVRRKARCLELQVLDSGPGIPKDKQEEVFEQFTQLAEQSHESSKGLGLGLSITKSLAELLHHPLALKSEQGKGCTFSIQVPETLPMVEVPVTNSNAIVSLQGVTVMCVDNDPAVLSGMVELLQTWKCQVISAASTVEAKENFEQHADDIDILLVDYQLENNNSGLELASELREMRHEALPAILITATTEEGIEAKAESYGVGFMRKLVKPAALRAMMSAKLTEELHQKYIATT